MRCSLETQQMSTWVLQSAICRWTVYKAHQSGLGTGEVFLLE